MITIIICDVGFQRSGKTLTAIWLSRKLKEIYPEVELWINSNVEGFNKLERISQVMHYGHKIVIIDEAYLNFDSRRFKNNTDITLFLNTLSKRKTMLIVTAPRIDMLDKRLREQALYTIVSIPDDRYIKFRIYDVIRDNLSIEFRLLKNEELFRYVKFDTSAIPDIVEVDI